MAAATLTVPKFWHIYQFPVVMSNRPSVRLSVHINAAPTGQKSGKFDAGAIIRT
jgi:hypothetical protein